MMKRYLLWLVLVILLAACQPESLPDIVVIPTLAATAVPIAESNTNTSSTAVDAAAAETSSEATEVEVAEADSSEGEESESGDDEQGPTPVNLDDFLVYDEPMDTDYLTTMEFYMKVKNAAGEMEETGRVYAMGVRTVNPNASTMTFDMFGGAGGGLGETMTITQIEDMFYYVVPPNECITFGGETGFENPFDLFLDTGGFLTGDVQRVLPNQNINGVDSRHYKIDPNNLRSIAVNEVYEGDLYVAEEGGFVTRLYIFGVGKDEVLSGNTGQEGEIFYELNYTPSNEVAAIIPPTGCGKSTLATDYPMLEDAVSVISMEGVFMYETHTPFEEIITFYKTEMTKDNEWSVTQELVQPPNGTVMFAGKDGTLMVNLGPGADGRTQVGIILTP